MSLSDPLNDLTGLSTNDFVCEKCSRSFTVPAQSLARYPGWVPKRCWACRPKNPTKAQRSKSASRDRNADSIQPDRSDQFSAPHKRAKRRASGTQELNLTRKEVLDRFHGGPKDGLFTDGACLGNPGPGGWGAVIVRDDHAVDERYGHEAETTNNRMELQALITAYSMIDSSTEITIYSDSNLCVRTINEWAAGWKARNWRRKGGPVSNLELVQEAYRLSLARPQATLKWIKAHDGSRWNEYADALATAFRRDVV